jgi:hypothetical protein
MQNEKLNIEISEIKKTANESTNKINIQKHINIALNKQNEEFQKEKKSVENTIFYYTIVNRESEKHVASYTYKQIYDYVILREKIIKENTDIDEGINNIVKYITDYIKHKNSNKYYLRKKIDRCLYLYDKYKEDLIRWSFSISYISNLNNSDWGTVETFI